MQCVWSSRCWSSYDGVLCLLRIMEGRKESHPATASSIQWHPNGHHHPSSSPILDLLVSPPKTLGRFPFITPATLVEHSSSTPVRPVHGEEIDVMQCPKLGMNDRCAIESWMWFSWKWTAESWILSTRSSSLSLNCDGSPITLRSQIYFFELLRWSQSFSD